MMRKVADMDLLPVAQIVKSYDVNGEVMIRMTSGILDDYIFKKEPVFIYFDGLPVPFYIESFTKRGNTKALVRLTDICSMEDVEEIAGKAVYIEEDNLPEMSIEEDGFAALVGWTLLTPAEELDEEDEPKEAAIFDEPAPEEIGEIAVDDAKAGIFSMIDMLKKEIEVEKEALEEKLSDLQDFYDKQRKMLQDQYDEEKYLEEQKIEEENGIILSL